MYDVIRIKRRLPNSPLNTIPALSGGELFFNEKNYTLYYGASAGTIALSSASVSGANVFNNNGDLILPDNGGIVFDRANTTIRVGEGFHISSGEGIDLEAIDTTDPENLQYKHWYFSPSGNVYFPTLGVDLHNGGLQNGQVLKFGDSNQQVIITGPTPEPGQNAQRLIIQGQRGSEAGGEGGDVYLWAGDANDNGGDIKIYAGDADNGGSGYGGYVNIDAGNGVSAGGNVSIAAGDSAQNGGHVYIKAGYSGVNGGNIALTTNNYANQLTFDSNGVFATTGAVVKSTVAKTGEPNVGYGEVSTVTLNPTNNTNFVPGTYYGIYLASGTGFSITLEVAGNGDLSATVTSSNPGFISGNYAVLNGGAIDGGTTGVDDITVTVQDLTNVLTPTPLDLTKSINKLASGGYSLADGTEGQILYLVPQNNADSSLIYVVVSHARLTGLTSPTNATLLPFKTYNDANASYVDNAGFCTLIFTDGHWQQSGGSWD